MSDYIDQELMIKILEHLPTESLFRFRRVCRWMRREINREFIQQSIDAQKPRFITVSGGQEVHVLDPHKPPMSSVLLARRSGSEPLNLVGTLNGTACFYYYKRHFVICNFLIQQSFTVPLPDFSEHAFLIAAIDAAIAAADTLSAHTYGYKCDDNEIDRRHVFSGFWMHPETREFKIVVFLLSHPDLGDMKDAIMYSSESRNWIPLVDGKMRMYPYLSESPAVFIAGTGYWILWKPYGIYLVSFDFGTQWNRNNFSLFSNACPDYELRYQPVLSRWQETLSLVFVNQENRAEVYLWDRDGIWHLYSRVDLSDTFRVRSMVEYEGKDTDLAEELQENRRILADATTLFFLQCEPLGQSLSVAYDYKATLLFPGVQFE